MKRILLIIIVIFLIYPNVSALNKEQQDNIATYAIEMIQKGNERKASDGTPLLKYGSGDTRLPAFKNQLYRGHFVLNCDAFVSYVLYHTYGFPVMKGEDNPYTTSNYERGPIHNSSMFKVARGSYATIKPYLEKGDIIVAFVKGDASHTFLYVGDGYIAQARSDGMFVDSFDWYSTRYSDYMIVRLKEEGATKPVDMSIVWPDTKEIEILGRDDAPTIKTEYDDTKFYKETKMIITFVDDKKIDSYSISFNNNVLNWITVDKKEEKIESLIKENGTYNIAVRDSKGQVTTKTIVVKNIDNQSPVIETIDYIYTGNNSYNITINAKDESELKYSLDGINFQQNNTFNNVELKNYELVIQDEALNQIVSSIRLTVDSIPKFEIQYDKNYAREVNIKIVSNKMDSIKSFAVQNDLNSNIKWQSVNGEINYLIDENGVYYVWVMDNNNVTYYETLSINIIDKVKPIIKKYDVVKKKVIGFDIEVLASDECQVFYSKDGINYQESNILQDLNYGDNDIYVKDCANNITVLKIMENNSVIKKYLIIALIIIIVITLIWMLIPKKKIKKLD